MKKLIALNIFLIIIFTTIAGCSKVGKEITTASGLKYVDEVIGNGPEPVKGQVVVVHFDGMFEDGKKFQSSHDSGKPISYKVGTGDVIAGLDEGTMTMKAGGKRKLIIPPALGYGTTGIPNMIPPNSTLIFEIELVEIKQ